jgi:pSer/pThr/pTyr-binding forkhead associated (FHA) protein
MITIDYTYLSVQKRFKSEANAILIGRPSDAHEVDLDLTPDATVSRRHARLICENGIYWLEDLGSRSGAWVNNQKITAKVPLATGDQIMLGQTNLVVQQVDTPPAMLRRPDLNQPVNIKEGVLTSTVRAADMASTILAAGERADVEVIRRRLAAFYDLSTALGTVEAVEPLLKTVVKHLCKAVPGAQRGALLLQVGNDLTLKASVPERTQPSVSLHLARMAMDKQEAYTWRR